MHRRDAVRILAGAALALLVGCARRTPEPATPEGLADPDPEPGGELHAEPPQAPERAPDLTPEPDREGLVDADPPDAPDAEGEEQGGAVDEEPTPQEPDPEPADEETDAEASNDDVAAEQDAPTRIELLCRDALGLAAAGDGARPHTIERLTVHHTAVELGRNRDAPGRLRGHQRFHRDQGWADIAYHYAVDLAGNAYELRDVGLAGDTFTDYDPAGHFLVVCEGDYDRQRPSDAMLRGVAELLAWGSVRFGVALDTVGGHRDYASTSCPGDHLQARLVDLRAEAAAIRGAGIDLDVVCGPEADARIAAIES